MRRSHRSVAGPRSGHVAGRPAHRLADRNVGERPERLPVGRTDVRDLLGVVGSHRLPVAHVAAEHGAGARRRSRGDRQQPTAAAAAQPLQQRARRIEPHHVAQVAMHVLKVLGPGALPGAAPSGNAIDLLDDPQHSGFCLCGARRNRELFDVVEARQQDARVAEKQLIQLAQCGARRFE